MFRGPRALVAACFALVIATLAGAAAQEHARLEPPGPRPKGLALVVGNAAYPAAPLATAANDAGLVAESLALAGFDVTGGADVGADGLRGLVRGFLDKAKAAASPDLVIVVYFAGYGLQMDGDNFVVPVDATIARDADVPGAAQSLAELARQLDAVPAKARLYVYDLARPTPFAANGAPLASGLMLTHPAAGSLVAFNTAPGTVAPADPGLYGAFARALAGLIATPGVAPGVLLDRLRLRVAHATDGAAIPWADSQLGPDVMLGGPPAEASEAQGLPNRPIAGLSPDVAFFLTIGHDRFDDYATYLAAFPDAPLTPRIVAATAARREAMIWAAALAANAPDAYWTYMRRYPRGPHTYDARRRLAALRAQLEPPPRFDLWPFPGLGVPTSREREILGRHPLTLSERTDARLPELPDGLLPPSPSEQAEVAIPPLAVAGDLPLPLPTRMSAPSLVGSIDQPIASGDLVSKLQLARDGSPEIVTSRGGAVVARTGVERAPGRRVVTQRDSAGAVLSRTVMTTAAGVVTTVQTGPTGAILKKAVTRPGADGSRTTTITDGSGKTLATIERDRTGVETSPQAGPGSPGVRSEIVEPAKGRPTVATVPVTAPPAQASPQVRPASPPITTVPSERRRVETPSKEPQAAPAPTERPPSPPPATATVTSPAPPAGPAPETAPPAAESAPPSIGVPLPPRRPDAKGRGKGASATPAKKTKAPKPQRAKSKATTAKPKTAKPKKAPPGSG